VRVTVFVKKLVLMNVRKVKTSFYLLNNCMKSVV